MRRGLWLCSVGLALVAGTATFTSAQDTLKCATDTGTTIIRQTVPRDRPLPFAVGEQLRYSVSFGKMHVGSGRMAITNRDSVRGHEVWRAAFMVSGGFWPFKVNDSTESWFDPATFTSHRFVQELREPRYKASKLTEIYPDRPSFQIRGKEELPSVADPMDEITFVYFARTLPLEPGQCYELTRYFRPEGNPVVLRVVKRDTIQVPAGRFPAIMIEPEIRTSAIFSKKGRAQVWLSDDTSRIVLQLKTQLDFGSINLYLSHVDTLKTAERKH